ncbi:MAG: hypothetical protein VXY61_00400 [Bacteroidota bacterium]|nr:hypothetical protein [Bacteroidota bacterium]
MAGFKNLEDLVGDLGAGLVKLRAGELEPEELTPLVEDARELCDRLVLLRFKAHEFAYEVRKKAPEGGVDEQAVDRQPVRPFRIGAAYQTSLIDAIEEVSREQAEQAAEARRNAGTPDLFDVIEPAEAPDPDPEEPEVKPAAEVPSEPTQPESEDQPEEGPVAEAIQPEPEPEPVAPLLEALEEDTAAPSLAEQLEQQSIGDLRTAFSLVEKYECIKVLFQDDAMLFDKALEALDGAGDVQLALHWLHQHVPDSKAWDEEDPTVARFLDKLQRRYA